MNTVYFAETTDGSRFPMYKATDGGIAVIWFNNPESAERYIRDNDKQGEWQLASRDGRSAVEWLNDAHVNEGVTHLVLDPPSKFDPTDVRFVPVDIVLLAMNLAGLR